MTQQQPRPLGKRGIRRAFDQAAASYDANAVLQFEIADRLLERLDLVRLAPKTILDVGSGTGYCARALARRYPRARIVGVDLAPAMVRRARQQNRRFSRSRFVCGDAEALPVVDTSIDLIVSNLTLQWCQPERVFAEFIRVLRPGGLLMFTSFGPNTLKELRQAWTSVDTDPHVHTFVDMHDLGVELMQAGFTDPVLDMENFMLTYVDVKGVLRDLKNIGTHNLAPDRRRGLTGKHAFARFRLAYESLAIEGRIPATYAAVFGHAWAPVLAKTTGDEVSVVIPVSAIGRRRS